MKKNKGFGNLPYPIKLTKPQKHSSLFEKINNVSKASIIKRKTLVDELNGKRGRYLRGEPYIVKD